MKSNTRSMFTNRIIIAVSSLFLAGVLIYGYQVFNSSALTDSPTNTHETSNKHVAYLTPQEKTLGEENLDPEILFSDELIEKYQFDLSVTIFSDFEQVKEAIQHNRVDALVIHYQMVDQIDLAELKSLFDKHQFVIAGVGIPGLELAEMIGDPALFTSSWSDESGYTTRNYYFLYVNKVSGKSKADVESVRSSNSESLDDTTALLKTKSTVSVHRGASTDSLLWQPESLLAALSATLQD